MEQSPNARSAPETLRLDELVLTREKELSDLGQALVSGQSEKAVSALLGLITALATTSPLLGTLAKAGVERAFAQSATSRLLAEYQKYEQEKDRERFVEHIDEAVRDVIAEAFVQMVRVQHNTKDEVLEALGGLREEWQDFRAALEHRLERIEHPTTVRAPLLVQRMGLEWVFRIATEPVGLAVRLGARRNPQGQTR
jgi:hypothetical protein